LCQLFEYYVTVQGNVITGISLSQPITVENEAGKYFHLSPLYQYKATPICYHLYLY